MANTIESTRHIVLLRGVNVGGNNKLPMADLRAALTAAGYKNVATYIQSGNIALDSDHCEGDRISRLIEAEFGLTIPAVVRTGDQLRATVEANPFPDMVDQPKFLHVHFCQEPIGADALHGLDRERFHPDRLMVGDAEVYVAYANGVAGSKLTSAVMDRAVGQVTTARNWNTVLKLVAMAESGS